ncbi:acyltransferase family protein [Rosistilla oblonga]|uniref:acyltransferase family protein n=1 Tax=Rosistilla oblonga TaxID=2527990 RepID=UPI003A96ECF0
MASHAPQTDICPAVGLDRVWRVGKHVAELDGLRGFAILIVTLYRFSKEIPTDSALGHLMHLGASFGSRGVELFFVLSGFLITGILIDAKDQPHYFRNFIARRSLRIFPLYFATLIALVVAGHLIPAMRSMFHDAIDNQFYLWTYLVNVKMSVADQWCFGYLDHFWSLAVEEHFYLVWPFVLYLISSKVALRTAVVLAIVSATARIAFVLLTDNGVAPDVLTLFRCDALLIGAAIALIARQPRGLEPLKRWLPITTVIGGLFVLACGVTEKRFFTIPLTIWPIVWGGILIWLLTANRSAPLARFFNLKFLRTLGKYSYAMYVFQNPLIPLTSAVVSVAAFETLVGGPLLANMLYIGVMFVLTYAAAVLSWNVLERHCLQLKRWFPTDGSEDAAARRNNKSTAGVFVPTNVPAN